MDSSTSDFLRQISGLLVITCISGLIWVVLMLLIARRAQERKRRKERGEPTLPSFYAVVLAKLRAWLSDGADKAPKASFAPKRATIPQPALDDFVPTPDLSMLTRSLSARTPEPERPSAIPAQPPAEYRMPVPPTPPEPEPIYERDVLPETPSIPPGDAVELLRVWRDLADGMLIVEINGKQFRSAGELTGTDLERRFTSVLRELNQMLRPAAPLSAVPPTSSSGSVLRQVGRVAMGQPAIEDKKPNVLMSIPDQIEEVLQVRLSELPDYRLRSIHVRPSISGGVRIEVDGRFYEGIGDVAEPDVRSLLTDVVREWESRQ